MNYKLIRIENDRCYCEGGYEFSREEWESMKAPKSAETAVEDKMVRGPRGKASKSAESVVEDKPELTVEAIEED